jgi:hypothetical protein
MPVRLNGRGVVISRASADAACCVSRRGEALGE